METLLEKNRRLNNRIITLQTFAQENKYKMKQIKRKGKAHIYYNIIQIDVVAIEKVLYEAVFHFNTYLANKLEQLLGQHSMSREESEKDESEMEEATESEDEGEAMEEENEVYDPVYEVEADNEDTEEDEEEIDEASG